MASRLNPYVHMHNNARAALDFYKSVFGGDLQVMPFGDMAHDPAEKELVMHGQLDTPGGFTLMVSDTPAGMTYAPVSSMAVSLSGDGDAELRGYWNKLSEGATITQPLEKAPWGDSFGMLVDKFGTPWMVNIAGPR